MEYKVLSSKFQDLQTRTIEFIAKSKDLGTVIDSVSLTIPLSDIGNITADDIIIAQLVFSGVFTVSVVGSDLLLENGSFSEDDVVQLVIKLP